MNDDDKLKLIKDNEALIYSIILKYKSYFDIQDLYQVAVIGLLKAYNNYNESYYDNCKFSTYAYMWIFGEVIKYISNLNYFKMSNNNKKIYKKVMEARDILSQKLMKEPSVYELANFLELDVSLVDMVINMNRQVKSLDQIIMQDSDDIMLYDKIGYTDLNIENIDLNLALDELSDEDRQIILYRYYNGYTQAKTARDLGKYQVDVSRKEKKILAKLKEMTY